MNALSSRQIAWSIVRYGIKPAVIAVYFVLLALLWTFPLQPLIAYPFVFLFFGAIVCSAWFGGFLAGLWAIAMSYVLLAFFVFAPLYSIAVGKESRTYVAAYIVCAIAITVVSVARRKTENAIRVARDQLEVRVHERTAELQRSNREILERERNLRRLTETIPQQIWSADETGCVEHCNRDLIQYAGRSAEELSGEEFFDIFHPEDVGLFRQSWDAARSSGEMLEAQVRIRSAAGTYRWFLVRRIPQEDVTGAIAQWYGVHIDIEEQQRAQQRMLQAHEEESRFARTMSMEEMAALIAHELNQPLTALVTHASACRRWLRAEPMNVARATAAADRMVRDSTRAGAVINRVRSLIGKADFVRQPTDVNELVADCVRLLRHDSIRRGVSVKLQLAEGLPRPKDRCSTDSTGAAESG
jgi:PAS domain S-box-containing protein